MPSLPSGLAAAKSLCPTMLPASVHRVPQTALVPLSLPRATAVLAAARLERRFSSSKPSRSDKSDVGTTQSVQPPSTRRGEKRKRKAKDASEKSSLFAGLPSVPNTSHMSQEALGLSSFFSLHRPISITQTMPRTVSDEHFASIFTSRSRAKKLADTTSTLSQSINQIQGAMAQLTLSGAQDDSQAPDSTRKIPLKNADGSESSVYLQVETMSGHFLPFCPPPLPEAEAEAEAEADAEAQSAEGETAADATDGDMMEARPQRLVYKALFTMEETVEPDGGLHILAHSPVLYKDPPPMSFFGRMAYRQARFDQAHGRGRRVMHALSVRRQRKLKIKKKKYKKLMKRTRNERRKLDKN